MVFVGIINGMIRQFGYARTFSELTAHQISSVTGIILFGVYIWLVNLRWPFDSGTQAAGVGGIWLVLTIAFEFLFGHYVAGHTWSRLLHDYNIVEGRLWGLVLLTIASAPYLFYKLRA
jgi:hypothetical protein